MLLRFLGLFLALHIWIYLFFLHENLSLKTYGWAISTFALNYTLFLVWFQRSLRDIANLYDCDASLAEIEHYRSTHDTGVLSSKCFKSSNVSAVLIDDGLQLDKMYDLEWHKNIIPNVYRVLRIERLAEDILNEVLNIPIPYLNTKRYPDGRFFRLCNGIPQLFYLKAE